MSPLVYGEDMLAEADAARGRLVNNYRELQSYAKTAPSSTADPSATVEGYRARFCAAMDEDFNTREAIAVMFEMARATNKSMADGTLSREEALCVRECAMFLRIADVADRHRNRAIKDIRLSMSGGSLVVDLVSDEDPRMELWSLEKLRPDFRKLFGIDLVPSSTSDTRVA